MPGLIAVAIICWCVCWCVIGYNLGRARGHTSAGFWWAFCLGPIGCLTFLSIEHGRGVSHGSGHGEYSDLARGHDDSSRACPFCAETIKKAAILCRYCGHDVQPVIEDSKTKSVYKFVSKEIGFVTGLGIVGADGDSLTIECGNCHVRQVVDVHATVVTCNGCKQRYWPAKCTRCEFCFASKSNKPALGYGCPRCNQKWTLTSMASLISQQR